MTRPARSAPDPLSCLFFWGYASLRQKQPNGAYTKISELARLGFWSSFPRVGNVCDTHVQLLVPAAGDYKFVTAAGVLFGPYGRVSVHGPF